MSLGYDEGPGYFNRKTKQQKSSSYSFLYLFPHLLQQNLVKPQRGFFRIWDTWQKNITGIQDILGENQRNRGMKSGIQGYRKGKKWTGYGIHGIHTSLVSDCFMVFSSAVPVRNSKLACHLPVSRRVVPFPWEQESLGALLYTSRACRHETNTIPLHF